MKYDEYNHICNIPKRPELDPNYDHAPKSIHTLNDAQMDLAIKNHLKYFKKDIHGELAPIFREELNKYGHIYAYNYMP